MSSHNNISSKSSAKAQKKAVQSTSQSSEKVADSAKATGRWTREEHFRFLEALKLYGKEWKRVQQHVGTRSSTQARSHAQKFFVKLEKKKKTMEQFLDDVDMSNLRTIMENDSDYGEEADLNVGGDISCSATSQQQSQSVKSNIKSSKIKKYKKPTFHIQQPRTVNQSRQNPINGGTEVEAELSLQDHSESQHSRNSAPKDSSPGGLLPDTPQTLLVADKSPCKTISELGAHPTARSSAANCINNPDSTSTQCTQPIVQKVTHKTPQIKPSIPGSMMRINEDVIQDTYSTDDKQNEGFALPLVGKRRRVAEASLARPYQPTKRQHLQSGHKKESRDIDITGLEMKRTKSAYPAVDKPFQGLFQMNKLPMALPQGRSLPIGFDLPNSFNTQQAMQQMQQMLQFQGQFPMNMASNFQLPNGGLAQTMTQRGTAPIEDSMANQEAVNAQLMLRGNSFPGSMHLARNLNELGQISLPMQPVSTAMLPQATFSQTPRLKANTMNSPILGAFEQENNKRAISVLDQDYEIMGLSRNNANLDEESFLPDYGTSMGHIDDLKLDFVKDEGLKMPFQGDGGLTDQDPMLLPENDGPFQDLPDTNNFGFRGRSMTFHISSSMQYNDLLNGLVDPKSNAQQQNRSRQGGQLSHQRLSFEDNEQNNL